MANWLMMKKFGNNHGKFGNNHGKFGNNHGKFGNNQGKSSRMRVFTFWPRQRAKSPWRYDHPHCLCTHTRNVTSLSRTCCRFSNATVSRNESLHSRNGLI